MHSKRVVNFIASLLEIPWELRCRISLFVTKIVAALKIVSRFFTEESFLNYSRINNRLVFCGRRWRMGEHSMLTPLVLLRQQDKYCTFQGSSWGKRKISSLVLDIMSNRCLLAAKRKEYLRSWHGRGNPGNCRQQSVELFIISSRWCISQFL